MASEKQILVIEPFYGGSHKQLLDTILPNINHNSYDLFTLPAKKWHWRARTSALHFYRIIPKDHKYQILFTTSVLNLAELLGVRPDLSKCHKIIYFHENQLVYPVQEIKERDCQYALNQIMSALAADKLIFNSKFNQSSFLSNIYPILNMQRDQKFREIAADIEPKCKVLYFPLQFLSLPKRESDSRPKGPLHIIWPHRWEHDKNPEQLVEVLTALKDKNAVFQVSIVGESFSEIPKCYTDLNTKLGDRIINYGYLTHEKYIDCLYSGDVVISTANHEFYGVSMLEATYCGCMPVAPNKLVYPELYPTSNLYNTTNQLIKLLHNWCRNTDLFIEHRKQFFANFTFEHYSIESLLPIYMNLFGIG